MKENIIIEHGIYDIIYDTAYYLEGYFHEVTQTYMPICNKLKTYLAVKGLKFNGRHGTTELYFTLCRSPDNHVETIAICHPHLDKFDFELGEDVALGRMKRMLGFLKKRIYEMEEYEKDIKLYDIKDKDGEIVKTVYKTIICKRVKSSKDGNPLVRRDIWHTPYNLDRRYPDIEHKDGTITAGELMYPYIYKLVRE